MSQYVVTEGLHEGEGAYVSVGEIVPTNTITMVGAAAAAYHGYMRNGKSAKWALLWGLLGGLSPLITNGVAFVQGFGKSK